MTAGIPLTDEDRAPWLARLRESSGHPGARRGRGAGVLGAEAALPGLLTVDPARVRWVYLWAPRELIAERLSRRTGHFMPPSLLDSQFATLEAPGMRSRWT